MPEQADAHAEHCVDEARKKPAMHSEQAAVEPEPVRVAQLMTPQAVGTSLGIGVKLALQVHAAEPDKTADEPSGHARQDVEVVAAALAESVW